MTADTDPVVNDALISVHATVHSNHGTSATTASVEKVKLSNLSSASTREDWQYFISCWEDYVRATKLAGSDRDI